MPCYIGIVHQNDNSAWGITFPDLPGCISAADALGELPARAAEAVALWLEVDAEAGHPRPRPSSLAAVRSGPDAEDAMTFLPVPAPAVDRCVRLNISLPASLVQLIDARVGPGLRSGFLADAVRRVLR